MPPPSTPSPGSRQLANARSGLLSSRDRLIHRLAAAAADVVTAVIADYYGPILSVRVEDWRASSRRPAACALLVRQRATRDERRWDSDVIRDINGQVDVEIWIDKYTDVEESQWINRTKFIGTNAKVRLNASDAGSRTIDPSRFWTRFIAADLTQTGLYWTVAAAAVGFVVTASGLLFNSTWKSNSPPRSVRDMLTIFFDGN
jgi:hypothetical protein